MEKGKVVVTVAFDKDVFKIVERIAKGTSKDIHQIVNDTLRKHLK